jgi:hypothetical protein
MKALRRIVNHDYIAEGEASYRAWRESFLADPEQRRLYEEEAKKKELWLQLVEARHAAGLTQQQVAERMRVSQAQVARIEMQGYDAYTLRTLRRYLDALGDEFILEVAIKPRQESSSPAQPVAA